MSESFDTLKATRHLKAAGVTPHHAEAYIDVVRDSRDGLATEASLQAGLEAIRSELATMRWVIGMIAAMVMAMLVIMLARTF